MSLKDVLAWEFEHIERMRHADRFMTAVYKVAPGVFHDLAETVYIRFCELEALGLWMRGYYALAHSLEEFPEVRPYHDALTAWQERHYLEGDSIASYVWNVQGFWHREPERFGEPFQPVPVSFMELFREEPLRQRKGRTPSPERLEKLVDEMYGGLPDESDSFVKRMARDLHKSGGLARGLESLGLNAADIETLGSMGLHRGRDNLDKARKEQPSQYRSLALHQCLRAGVEALQKDYEDSEGSFKDYNNILVNLRKTAEQVGIAYRPPRNR